MSAYGASCRTALIWAVVILLLLGAWLARGSFAVAATPAKPPADPAEEARFQTVVAGVRWIKENQKNPESFELISAGMIGTKTICYTYRARNSFNALVVNHHVIGEKVNSNSGAAWSKHCAGKSGKDYTSAKYAL